MARAKNRADWNRTSHLLAVLINANRDLKKYGPVSPEQLNPYTERKKPEQFVSIATLAKALTKGKRKRQTSP